MHFSMFWYYIVTWSKKGGGNYKENSWFVPGIPLLFLKADLEI